MITFVEDNVWFHFSYRIRHLDDYVIQICIFLTTFLLQQSAYRHSHEHFQRQVSEKCILYMQAFPWKLEISRAVTQYSTTEMLSSREGLGFQEQASTVVIFHYKDLLLVFQFDKSLLFRQVIYTILQIIFVKQVQCISLKARCYYRN